MAAPKSAHSLIPIENIVDTLLGHDTVLSNVRMFGTPEHPLMPVVDVGAALKLVDISRTIARWGDELVIRECEVIATIADGSTRLQRLNVFTEEGLYQFLFTSRVKLAKEFRKFVLIVLRRLRLNGQVKLADAQAELKAENDRLAAALNDSRLEAWNLNHTLTDAVTHLRELQGDPDDDMHENSPEKRLNRQFCIKYAKPVYIYAVDPEWVALAYRPKSKPKSKAAPERMMLSDLISDLSPDEDEVIDLKEPEETNIHESVDIGVDDYTEEFSYMRGPNYDPDRMYYLYLTRKKMDNPGDKYTYVNVEYVGTPKDFATLKEKLAPHKTHRAGVFATSLAEVRIDARCLLSLWLMAAVDKKEKEVSSKKV
jgi:prophage antirepressor-like protein